MVRRRRRGSLPDPDAAVHGQSFRLRHPPLAADRLRKNLHIHYKNIKIYLIRRNKSVRRSMFYAEVVRMKRVLSFLLFLTLVFSVCAFAETNDADEPESVPLEEGDDSNPVPVDMMEEEELEIEEEENIPHGRALQYGDEGDDVLALQTRLKDLKYYTGNLSGRFKEGTRKAVETFQADFDLEETG